MVSLGRGQKPVVMPRYTHMMTEDTLVWTKFLESGAFQLNEVWYDVHVGHSVLSGFSPNSVEQRVADGVTRKRIDVVASVGGGHWVIEVKPHASMYALGQVITYARLFAKEYVTKGEVIPVIVADTYDEDLVEQFDEMGVLVIANLGKK